MPESSIPSRFLEEVPSRLIEDLGSPPARPQFSSSQFSGSAYATPYPQRNRFGRATDSDETVERHYSYEDEDQTAQSAAGSPTSRAAANKFSTSRVAPGSRPVSAAGSMDNIANFFAARGQKSAGVFRPARPKLDIPAPTGKTGLRQGSRVRHPKYGEGTTALKSWWRSSPSSKFSNPRPVTYLQESTQTTHGRHQQHHRQD
jgi:DNA helicase-2/ATP-dependent DNA helicase PcrA